MRVIARRIRRSYRDDAGMATAEYAVATVAACGFGGILLKVLTSDWIMDLIKALISAAVKAFL